MGRRRPSKLHGVVVIDKPPGRTSHDVVQAVRRAVGERRVGHAGTLDPMATGVLVVMVGEATKLAPFLTADDKVYEAEITFGRATDTLDDDGTVTATAPLPDWWMAEGEARLQAALEAETSRTEQVPPVVSAIKVQGRAAHARVRDGEELDLPPRPVAVRSLTLRALEGATARVAVDVAKGYYVRALGRDLGQRLGVPAVLTKLRRVRSGAFGETEAVPLDGDLRSSLQSLVEAAQRALPRAVLTTEGCARARCGGPMRATDFSGEVPPEAGAWLDPEGHLVAIGAGPAEAARVLRGFAGTH